MEECECECVYHKSGPSLEIGYKLTWTVIDKNDHLWIWVISIPFILVGQRLSYVFENSYFVQYFRGTIEI